MSETIDADLDLPDSPADRVDYLVSALIDEFISDHEIRELGVMLENDVNARRRYLEGMQLHADLMSHFQGAKQPPQAESPVLGFLGANEYVRPEDSNFFVPPTGPTDTQ